MRVAQQCDAVVDGGGMGTYGCPDTVRVEVGAKEFAGVAHNVHVYSEDPAANPSAKSLFTGTIVTGPTTTTYSLAALPAGSYYFHCDVHPTTMKGRLLVK